MVDYSKSKLTYKGKLLFTNVFSPKIVNWSKQTVTLAFYISTYKLVSFSYYIREMGIGIIDYLYINLRIGIIIILH